MSLWRLVLRGLVHYRWTGAAILCGVAVATAAIAGSLLVGDSITQSLRNSALARLGDTHAVLISERCFRSKLAQELSASRPELRFAAFLSKPAAIRKLSETGGESEATVQGGVLGVEESFWKLYSGPPLQLGPRRCAVNEALARDLGLKAGDTLEAVVAKPGARAGTFEHRERRRTQNQFAAVVAAILTDDGPAGFSLGGGALVSRNVLFDRSWLADQLQQPEGANALAAAPAAGDGAPPDPVRLAEELDRTCLLADYGLRLTVNAEQGYVAVEVSSVLLNEPEVQAVERSARALDAKAARTSMYLAETVRTEDAPPRESAYVIVAGMAPLTPFRFLDGGTEPLDNEGLWLNSWLAEDLGAKVGTRLKLAYPIPKSDGRYEYRPAAFTVRGIVELSGPADDRRLTPKLEGVTDSRKVTDWDTPFPIDQRRIRNRDEEYWEKHQAAPKAFISLDAARTFWEASAGAGLPAPYVTSVRVAPPAGMTPAEFLPRLERELRRQTNAAAAGLLFLPVRSQALAAASGSTDFTQLFLSLSFFIVFSAAGLAGMLMRLMAQRRAGEAGLMLACGFSASQVRRVILAEGAALSLAGALAGVPAGLLYAAALVRGLGSFWSGALGSRAVEFHATWASLLIGGGAGLAVGFLSAAWGVRLLLRHGTLALLAGWRALGVLSLGAERSRKPGRLLAAAAILLLFGAGALAVLGAMGALPMTPAFFGGGAALLAGGLCCASLLLRAALGGLAGVSWTRLALRNASAQRGRSLLAIGLLAAAAFILVTVAAMQRDLNRLQVRERKSGAGGFCLRAVTALPVQVDWGTSAGRRKLRFAGDDEAVFEQLKVYGCHLSAGEDISCLNIARPARPRLLGVPDSLIERGGFTVRTAVRGEEHPWRRLRPADSVGAVPLFGDASSVTWSLKKGLGQEYLVQDESGRDAAGRFDGVLVGSIFQSEVLVHQSVFKRLHPGSTGERYFLIETLPGKEEEAARAVRRNLAAWGVEVRGTREILAAYLSVQNTFLSVFLALGGLGVLLGSVGLLAVLLRSAFERRGELALMQAVGLRRGSLAGLLVLEHTGLLAGGLVLGAIAALAATAPALAGIESDINWGTLSAWLAGIFLAGLLGCAAAARASVGEDVVQALREE